MIRVIKSTAAGKKCARIAAVCLLLSVFLCLSVFAVVPENGIGGGNPVGSSGRIADVPSAKTDSPADPGNRESDIGSGIVGDKPEDAIVGDAENGIIEEKPEGTNPGVIGSTSSSMENSAGWVILVVLLAAAVTVLALIFSPKRSGEY